MRTQETKISRHLVEYLDKPVTIGIMLNLLSSVRKKLRIASTLLAKYVAHLDPNTLTVLGLSLSMLTPMAAYLTKNSLIVAATASLAMLMDALDGSVARLRGKTTALGAFLDSLSDRLSDALLVLAFYPLGCDYLLIYLVTTFSMTTSYIRARAESLGLKGLADVGLMTREFRSFGILIAYIVHYLLGIKAANYTLLVLLLGLCVTVIQRSYYVIKSLKRSIRRVESM
ncbi:MAG: CDP-alcohol phosphatidyltransferase family protein [Sulfolobales archaeon]